MAKITLVEDEVAIARIVKITLESDGHDVVICPDGSTALSTLRQETPDLLLLDINLPDMKGFDVLRILHKDESYVQPLTVMLTAQSDIDHRMLGVEYANDYITKPFSPKLLRQRVHDFLTLNRQLDLPANVDALEGHMLGEYSVTAKLAQSEHAILYRATSPKYDTDLVLKFLLGSDVDDGRRQRFMLEIVVVSQLRHPSISPVYKIEKLSSEHTCMVMPFIEGEELKTIMERHPRGIGLAESIDYAIAIAEPLAYAHKQQVVHRDIKPENIIVTPDNQVCILDFGALKLLEPGPTTKNLTNPGMLLGTMTHMAPEMLSNQPIDHRIDIWSFGIIFFQMLAGQHPFKPYDGNIVIMLDNILNVDIPWNLLVGYSQEVTKLIESTLQKDPRARCSSFEQVLESLYTIKENLA